MTAYMKTGSPRIKDWKSCVPRSPLFSRAKAQPAKRNERAMGTRMEGRKMTRLQVVFFCPLKGRGSRENGSTRERGGNDGKEGKPIIHARPRSASIRHWETTWASLNYFLLCLLLPFFLRKKDFLGWSFEGGRGLVDYEKGLIFSKPPGGYNFLNYFTTISVLPWTAYFFCVFSRGKTFNFVYTNFRVLQARLSMTFFFSANGKKSTSAVCRLAFVRENE